MRHPQRFVIFASGRQHMKNLGTILALTAVCVLASGQQINAQPGEKPPAASGGGGSCCAVHKPDCGKIDKQGRCAGCGMMMAPEDSESKPGPAKRKSKTTHVSRRVIPRHH
jgi:hypothetical protein